MIIQSGYLGELIQEYREKKEIPQNMLARQIGCSPQFLGRIEKEEIPIPERLMISIIFELKLPKYKIKKAFLKNAMIQVEELFKEVRKI